MTRDELLELLATDPDVRAAVREAVQMSGGELAMARLNDKADQDAAAWVKRHKPGWLTRAPHERKA